MDLIPTFARIPARDTATAKIRPRYEDIVQDGRLRLTALPYALGQVVWGRLLGPSKVLAQLTEAGISPILTQLVLEGGDGPISVANPLEATGRFQFAHGLDEDGDIDRLVLNMWAEVHGTRARTWDPQPPGAGESIQVGRIFAEHTLTKPYAPAGARQVRSLSRISGLSPYPQHRYYGNYPAALQALPRGAESMERLRPDPVPVLFGLDDTDSNQHVNSLVYPELFRAAAMRRFHELGRIGAFMVRSIEIGFRKPCFAGDEMHIRLRAFRIRGAMGAVCTLGTADPEQKAHCYARLIFGP